MIIDNKLLQKLAHLVRIEFSEQELTSMLHDLNEMLSWLKQLDEVNLESNTYIENPVVLERHNLREDIPMNSLSHEQALKLASSNDSNYFKIPPLKKSYQSQVHEPK